MKCPSCGCLSRVSLGLRTVPSEQRRPALSHHDLSHTLKPLNTIKQHDLYQLDRVPTSPRCLVRAYLIGANGCLPRPLGTTQPPRNYYHLPARPDLGDVQAGLQPLGHASQATAARGGMSEPWMPDENRLAATCAARAPRHKETTQNHPGVDPRGGEGYPHPPPQTSPHNPLTLCLQARARDGRAGGGGTVA